MQTKPERAEYIRTITQECTDLAFSANFDTLVYLFRMVELETENLLKASTQSGAANHRR